tara:strand:+ start:2410 stop:4155 length:1746 start_codon:yes stop_codon:yes gene_type:complete
MDRKELIEKYIKFFKSKDHVEIGNASLVPENDPTVLFTTAGMHPLVPFLLGEKHPSGKRLCNVQRCIRTGDIEEVGNTTHHTFFEMLGNWSLGDYWKKEAIEFSFEFLVKVLKIPVERLAISVFEGDNNSPKDSESASVWESQGIPKERISFLPKSENWWGPAGKTGPCGPCTEMFYWKLNDKPAPKKFDPKNENWVEIWNDVLMEYDKDKRGNYIQAKQKNIDTGMGVERTVTILNNLEDNYLAEMWKPIIKKLELISKHKYGKEEKITRAMRIIADHIKASVFIIQDGIVPGTSEQGYVLRRLIRRAIRHGRFLEIENFTTKIADSIYGLYKEYNLEKKKISLELEKEEKNFLKTLEKGLKIFEKMAKNKKQISGKNAFLLYQSYGFPIEITMELAQEKNLKLNEKDFLKEAEKHQKLSRTSSSGKFKSGLVDNSQETTKLHTATHMLNKALQVILKDKGITQKGSNITPERLRFDFNIDRKLTDKEKQAIEDLINKKIKKSLSVTMEEMTLEEAKKQGALGIFDSKYGKKVKVYSIGDYSKEICGGPHVKNIGGLGHFKIIKEESSSAGIRRIKAILE